MPKFKLFLTVWELDNYLDILVGIEFPEWPGPITRTIRDERYNLSYDAEGNVRVIRIKDAGAIVRLHGMPEKIVAGHDTADIDTILDVINCSTPAAVVLARANCSEVVTETISAERQLAFI